MTLMEPFFVSGLGRHFLAVLCVSGAAVLASCSQPKDTGAIYKLPVAEAYRRLMANPFNEFQRFARCGIVVEIKSSGATDERVTWRIMSGGREMLWLTATLTALDPTSTKVVFEVGPREWNGREAYDGAQLYIRPAVQQPVRPAFLAQVDAILAEKPFDASAVMSQMRPKDRVCQIQRGGRDEGVRAFSIDDEDVRGRYRAIKQ